MSLRCSFAPGTQSAICSRQGQSHLSCKMLNANLAFSISLIDACVQVRGLDSKNLEPEREQLRRLHPAGAAPLHPRRRPRCAEQQRRHLTGLECETLTFSPFSERCQREIPSHNRPCAITCLISPYLEHGHWHSMFRLKFKKKFKLKW